MVLPPCFCIKSDSASSFPIRPSVPGVELSVPLGPEEVADRAPGAVLHGDLTALRLRVETLTLAKYLSEQELCCDCFASFASAGTMSWYYAVFFLGWPGMAVWVEGLDSRRGINIKPFGPFRRNLYPDYTIQHYRASAKIYLCEAPENST